MSTSASAADVAPTYKIWGADGVIYGPVELPVLVTWVKDERVVADSWVYVLLEDKWRKAAELSELALFFGRQAGSSAAAPGNTSTASPATTTAVASAGGAATASVVSPGSAAALRPGCLRRVKILAELSDTQLERFVGYMEVERAGQWTDIVRQGDHGDAMYLVLEGEVRVRMMISGKESILVTLGAGEFFGEIALLDSGPRSADVVANMPTVLLKISAAHFERLRREAPELAAPFLLALARSLTARIRADNRRYRDSVNFARAAQAHPPAASRLPATAGR